MPSKMQEKHLGSICPQCSYGTMQEPNTGQEWHLECTECGTILFCYEPLPHQVQFHADSSRIKAFFGGYG